MQRAPPAVANDEVVIGTEWSLNRRGIGVVVEWFSNGCRSALQRFVSYVFEIYVHFVYKDALEKTIS